MMSIRRGDSPEEWKMAKLILIPKPGKNPMEASAYRPLCLINTPAKLYEGAILQKIKGEMTERGGLHDRQYGFIEGRSTLDALTDVMNAVKEANQQNKWCAPHPLRRKERVQYGKMGGDTESNGK
ncbi:hypothetical protein NQ317_019097 [Molorchus minor]|uniref:Reverse transcriptase domain-containing protein n=1 Tax=Molorchus minor TaxID=1323400 RepID=A0ABQ9JKC8_9CUCU|nr:hypothetical protein NQ317_019097 [Molorchus minor]